MSFQTKRYFSANANSSHHETMLNYLKDFLPLIAVDFDKNGPIISVKPENLLFVSDMKSCTAMSPVQDSRRVRNIPFN